jgi:hypothetical protein
MSLTAITTSDKVINLRKKIAKMVNTEAYAELSVEWLNSKGWKAIPLSNIFSDTQVRNLLQTIGEYVYTSQGLAVYCGFFDSENTLLPDVEVPIAYKLDFTEDDFWLFDAEFSATGNAILTNENFEFAILREAGADYALIAGQANFVLSSIDKSAEEAFEEFLEFWADDAWSEKMRTAMKRLAEIYRPMWQENKVSS